MKRLLIVAGLLTLIVLTGCAKKTTVNVTTTGDQATDTNTVTAVGGVDIVIAAGQKGTWEGKKVGGAHEGTINLLPDSVLSIDSNGNVLGGKIIIAMNSITNTDLEDATMNAKLVKHLKSADFFDTANHPTAEFTAKGVNGNDITADVTIRGVTKEMTFPITLTKDGDGYLLSTELEIQRKDFEVGVSSLLDKLAIADTFTIKLDKVAFLK